MPEKVGIFRIGEFPNHVVGLLKRLRGHMRPAGCLPCYNVLKFVTERQTDTHGRAHEVLFAFFNALARKRKDYTHTHIILLGTVS